LKSGKSDLALDLSRRKAAFSRALCYATVMDENPYKSPEAATGHLLQHMRQFMNPRDVFRVIVATFGLYSIWRGALDAVDSVWMTMDLVQLTHSSPKYFAARGAFEIVFGLLLIHGFFPFVNWAFPTEVIDDSEHTSNEQAKEEIAKDDT
jgi:hypothetical protein